MVLKTHRTSYLRFFFVWDKCKWKNTYLCNCLVVIIRTTNTTFKNTDVFTFLEIFFCCNFRLLQILDSLRSSVKWQNKLGTCKNRNNITYSLNLSPFPGSTWQALCSNVLCKNKETFRPTSNNVKSGKIKRFSLKFTAYIIMVMSLKKKKNTIITISYKLGQLGLCPLLFSGFLSWPSLYNVGRIQLPTHGSKLHKEPERQKKIVEVKQRKRWVKLS